MLRRGETVSSVSQISAWLTAAGGLVAYAALVLALGAMGTWPEIPFPGWLVQLVPPVVYGGLVFVFARRPSAPRLAAATLLLWGVHLGLAALTGMAVAWLGAVSTSGQSPSAFPPSPLPALLWVPLLLFPLRDVMAGRPRRSGARKPKEVDRSVKPATSAPATAHAAPAVPAKPAMAGAPSAATAGPVSAEKRADSGLRPLNPDPRQAAVENGGSAVRAGRKPPAPEPVRPAEPPRSRRLPDEILARETSADVVRVSFDRVAGQIPAGAFRLPLDRMGAGLLEPGYLLIPQRLVVGQLAEGLVRADWKVVSEQFPRHLLALTDEEIERQLPEGRVVLPLDELVTQLPRDIFLAGLPAVDLGGIEGFPAPFQPAAAEDQAAAPQGPTAGIAPATVEIEGTPAPAAGGGEWVLEEDPVLDDEPPIGPEPLQRLSALAPADSEGGVAAEVQAIPPPLVAAPALPIDEPAAVADPGREDATPGTPPLPPDDALAPTSGSAGVAPEDAVPEAPAFASDFTLAPPAEATGVAPEDAVPESPTFASDLALASTPGAADAPPEDAIAGTPACASGFAPAPTERPADVAPEDAMPETPVFPSAFAPAPTPRVSSAPDAAREIPAFASDCALAPTPGAAGVPPASDRFHAAEPRPAAAAAMSGHAAGTPRGDDARALARWIGAHATPLTAVDVAVKSVEGLTLFLVSSTELPGDLAMEAARPLVALLAAARAPWEVDQMTFRGPDAALILTPLGPLAHGGSVLGWAVRPDGNLAMLEVLSLRAAAENGARATPSGAGGRAAAGERQGADLVDTEPPGRVRRAAASLGALGPVTAVAFRDAAAARDVYLFLPAGTDARPVGRFASELDDAVRATTAWGLGLHTAVLRCGKRRLIVRLEGGERSSILVAGGETDRPGLAHRQVESVALTLDTR